MKFSLYLFVSLLFCTSYLYGQNTLTIDSTTLTIDTVYTGLDVPWEIQWGADGWIWTTERYGIVSRIDPAMGTKVEILDIEADVYSSGESGLLGMVLHPQFTDTPSVYLVYTYVEGTIKERMVRYTYNGTNLIPQDTLIEGIPGNTTHIGSRLIIGPDYKLYMTTGDAQNQNSPQNVNIINGKTLRFNLDGSVPADNPIPSSYVWSWGHRNAQGLVFGPTGILYSSEHGPSTDDEFNILKKGRNYGWPTVTGFCDNPNETALCTDSNVVEPLFAWTPTVATSDCIYYDHPSIPEWQGSILLTILKDKQLIEFKLNAAGDTIVDDNTFLTNRYGRFRDILQGPNGELYIATNGASWSNTDPNTHSIIRLQNLGYIPPAPTANAGSSKSICLGDNVILGSTPTASGGTAPYTYLWSPAASLSCDTCEVTTATPTQTTTYTVLVTDANSATATASVTITILPDTTINGFGYLLGGWADSVNVRNFGFDAGANFPGGGNWTVIIQGTDTSYYMGRDFLDTLLNFECALKQQVPTADCHADLSICFTPTNSCITYCIDTTLTFDLPNGINEKLEDIGLTLMPNPANNQVQISLVNAARKLKQIRLYNSLGQEVLSLIPELGNSVLIDISSFKTGLYFLQVETDMGMVTRKLLID